MTCSCTERGFRRETDPLPSLPIICAPRRPGHRDNCIHASHRCRLGLLPRPPRPAPPRPLLQITSLGPQMTLFDHLHTLALTGNPLKTLRGAHLPRSLRVLQLAACGLTSLENLLESPPALQHLGLAHNQVGGGARQVSLVVSSGPSCTDSRAFLASFPAFPLLSEAHSCCRRSCRWTWLSMSSRTLMPRSRSVRWA